MTAYLAVLFCLLPAVVLGANIQQTEKEVCYPDLGCFSNGYPWYDPPDRPISYLPDSRESCGTEFLLNTRQNPDPNASEQKIINTDLESIKNSYFDPARDTKIITHGFVQNGNVDWMRDMVIEWINHGDYNVIRVNWIDGSLGLYGDATANIRVVGAEIAFLVDQIRVVYGGYDASKIHIIGHSLGAHLAGHAGERLPGLARITGIDPAGPYFENVDPIVRLDPTDAIFVDSIHSDSDPILNLGMGILMPVSHVDFYPNEGREQPGCDQGLVEKIIVGGGIYDGAVSFIACNHLRAVYFFTESINGHCPFVSEECPSGVDRYVDFLNGNCVGEGQAEMGLHAIDYFDPSRTNVIYYSKTYDDAPFCGHQYHVHLFLDDPWNAEQFRAFVYMTFEGAGGTTEEVIINENGESLELRPAFDYHFVAAPRFVNPGTLSAVYLKWDLDYEWYNPGDWPIFDDPEIFISRMEIKSIDTYETYEFCGSTQPIDEGRDNRKFTRC